MHVLSLEDSGFLLTHHKPGHTSGSASQPEGPGQFHSGLTRASLLGNSILFPSLYPFSLGLLCQDENDSSPMSLTLLLPDSKFQLFQCCTIGRNEWEVRK